MINRITPGTLTIAVVSIKIALNGLSILTLHQIMDSMDWFDPAEDTAPAQARTFNKALKKGGRILLRSASINPWYIKHFEENGFSARRVGARFPGTCIDR